MHDINGKVLHVGDEVCNYALFGTVKVALDEREPHMGGTLVLITTTNGDDVELRTHEHKLMKVRSWKELAQEALNVQHACNLSGVVHSFSRIISEVRARLESESKGGTDMVNNHPVCRLFSDKVAHLTKTQMLGCLEITRAYQWAYDITKGK